MKAKAKAYIAALIIQYQDFLRCWTDGSVKGRTLKTAACAYHIEYKQTAIHSQAIPLAGIHSINLAELQGIFHTLQYLLQHHTLLTPTNKQAVIFCDNKYVVNVLNQINKPNSKHLELYTHILQLLRALNPVLNFKFEWIPSHCETPGNDIADHLASIVPFIKQDPRLENILLT